MKTNHRLILTLAIFTGLVARPALADKPPGTNTFGAVVAEPPTAHQGPPALAPEVKLAKPAAKKKTAAAKKAVKAKTAKKAVVPTGFSVPLKPGAATVAAKRVNIRGQATTRSEVLGRLTNGEPVTVIEEITRANTKADEPSVWAKIVLPAGKNLWANSQFVDTNKTVKVKKLNLRTGPGENFSVAGHLLKGDTITDIVSTNGWLEVQSPSNAYAYVAAAYLKQEATPTVIPAGTPVEVAPTTTTTVAETTAIAAPPTGVPITSVPETNAAVVATVATNVPAVAPEPPQPRIVQREGIVRRTFSIQAPSTFELVNADTGRTVNYLYTTSKQLDLTRYKGLHIIVTGEEELDERWLNTPVITIQKIQVVE